MSSKKKSSLLSSRFVDKASLNILRFQFDEFVSYYLVSNFFAL